MKGCDQTLLLSTSGLSGHQIPIMECVQTWVRTQKTPIPQREVITSMSNHGISEASIVNALNTLMKKGYIARVKMYASTGNKNKTFYKQLRNI